MTKNELSVTLIAKDASATIGKCLKSASLISDDLVVVIDSATSDDTSAICKKFTPRIFTRKFDNFAAQKNYALTHVSHAWVLSLDADEWLSDSLQSEISALIPKTGITAYSLPRKNIIFSRVINHTNWDPHGLIRLFNKRRSDWVGDVHEHVKTSGQIGVLSGILYHSNYTSVEQFLTRQDKYSTLEADAKFRAGVKFNLFVAFFQPVFEFFRRFVWHAGFLDGWHGFYLSYLMAIYHFSVWVKLWQKYHAV